MPRFFIEGTSPVPGDRITLSEEDTRHVSLSLRMKRGDALTLCDGMGTDFGCVAVDFAGAVTVEVVSVSPSAGEPPYRAAVFQAEIKGDKFDTVIQKSVELGASGIVPFTSSRCVCRPDARDAEKKKIRRERIALEAAKQCGRGIIPSVGATLAFGKMTEQAANADLPLFCWEEASTPLKDVLRGKDPSTVSVVIGPEGGFSADEAKTAHAAGMIPVSLGRRILRTETAAGAVLSVLSYEFDR
jgi:16S rRNA (uracil1498-N3)-methyltransferase